MCSLFINGEKDVGVVMIYDSVKISKRITTVFVL